ncbi:hypothetical protein I350_00555 [Cryptococcus amylolentus CBS 6273]|uniref:Zn(2)-C6 fungal-type domain-containing protein n=1 Tax=Cryptococcus amylolentus CBS 6273 TaxID=1296118 RepID=A0A1E3KFA1_9TREE|nr:hypothetical protein I350_00555 [Cryptococcus amylolentus CBS 6273]
MPRTPSLSPLADRRLSAHEPYDSAAADSRQSGNSRAPGEKKQPPSCDACRARKLKCSGRPQEIELGPDSIATVPCNHCREWSLDCSYLYQRKRRGRKNKVVEQLAEEQRARKQQATGSGLLAEQHGSSNHVEEGLSRDDRQRERAFEAAPGASFGTAHAHPADPSHPAHAESSLGRHYPQSSSRDIPRMDPPSSVRHDTGPYPPYPPTCNLAPDGPQQPAGPSPEDGVSPSIALSEASVPPTTTIESVLPRDLAMHCIHIYFDHASFLYSIGVYCIIPVIHRPSFNADLAAHAEERNPVFFALIMAMIAATLIHVPKSFFPAHHHDSIRRLSVKCLKACYAVTIREMDKISVDLICIKYLIFVVHNASSSKHGNAGLEASTFGEAQYLAISLGLHREDTYANFDPITAERGRRIWFLIYNADKFEAVARHKPVLLRNDEFLGPESTLFPAEVDDSAITVQGIRPSSNPFPLICGFNILTRIVSILGEILLMERDMRRRQPNDPEELLAALKEVRKLQQQIKQVADNLPKPFKLDVGQSSSILPEPGWEEAIRDELDLFFADPMSSETAKDGYLVLKGNIHVTLAMTRLRLILHREDLLNKSGQPGSSSRYAAELVSTDLGEMSTDWRQSVYRDLFNTVHCLPIQALAANGPSVVTKIRVVAVTLLDALPAEEVNSSVQGIADYLLDFLNIMSSIEDQTAD